MGKYDNMGLSPDEIKEMERLDAEEILLEKRNKINSLRQNVPLEHKVVVQAKKSKNGYQLLGLLFGCFGLHDLYAGYYKLALLYFTLTVISFFIYPTFISVIWCAAILEVFLSVKDADGNKLE